VKRVCYVFQDKYPWDVRVEKIMDSLANHGIEGHIMSKNQGSLPRAENLRDNLIVHRLPGFSSNFINTIVNMPAFFSPFWIFAIYRLVRKTAASLLIVRDLPLAPAALLAGKLSGCPVLMDMAENYPAMIRDTWKYRGPGKFDYLIRNPVLLGYMEKMVVPRLDGILAVSEYSKQRVAMLGMDPSRIWIVGNTPRLDQVGTGPAPSNPQVDQLNSLSSFILMYTGGMEESRGLDIVIKALPEIHKTIPSATFVIVGAGTSESRLKALAEHLGVKDKVLFTGWVDNRDVPAMIKAADVCIVPHYVTEHTDTTIPNKIFDYMLQRKPVVVTNSRSLSDIVSSSDCGKIYVHDNPIDLARKIVELKDPLARKTYGDHGYEAVMTRYNWSFDEKNLFAALEISRPSQ